MTFKRGIHIEVDEMVYRTIQEKVEALNNGFPAHQPRMTITRFVKTLVDDWVAEYGKEVPHGEEEQER